MAQEHLLKLSRLEGLSDGIFAIAMTILVLDLRLPAGTSVTDLSLVLHHYVLQRLLIYMGSFIILGTLWIAINFQVGLLTRVNRLYLWTHVFYLMVICVVPFSASLLASYPENPSSILFYALNLILAYIGQYLIFSAACFFKLNGEGYTSELHVAVVRRLCIAPIFFVAAIILAHWNMRLAFLMLIAPTVIYIIPGKIDKFESNS
jgi:uncharacterized membrane protein